MFCSLSSHQHCPCHVDGKYGFKAGAVHIDERLEHANAGIVNEDVEMAELSQNLAHGSLDIALTRDVRSNRCSADALCRLSEVALIPPGDGNFSAGFGEH